MAHGVFFKHIALFMWGRQQGEWIEICDELKDAEEFGHHKWKEMACGLKVTTNKENGVNRLKCPQKESVQK